MPGPTLDELLRMAGAFGIVAAAAVPIAGAAWVFGRRLMPPGQLRWRTWRTWWSGLDLITLALVYFALPGLAVAVIDQAGVSQEWFGPDIPTPAEAVGSMAGSGSAAGLKQYQHERNFYRMAVAGLIALPVFLAVVLCWQVMARKEDPPTTGRLVRRFPGDLALGVAAWLVLTPVTFAVHFGVNMLYTAAGGQPAEHPLTHLDPGRSAGFAILFVVTACVVTPLYEELMFRRLLLPWSIPRGQHQWYRPWVVMGLAIVVAYFRAEGDGWAGPVMFTVVLSLGLVAVLNGRKVWRRFPVRTVAAVYTTAALFAAMHSSVWPSPVPLFVLGLGLGYLVARTHAVGAAAVCHGLFNLVSAVFLLRGTG